jgi:hypothetical protein
MLVDSVNQNGVSPGGFNLANTGNLRPAGVIGGAQVGANYEFAPWVVGVEGTWTESAINGNTVIGCAGAAPACQIPPTPTFIASERFTSQAQWFAALTGRGLATLRTIGCFTPRLAAPGCALDIPKIF